MAPREVTAEIGRCGEYEELSRKERWEVMQRWREVFAAPYHAATGKWKNEFDWDVFSFGHTRTVRGMKAVEMYESQPTSSFLVVCDERCQEHRLQPAPAFRCRGGRWPNLLGYADDFYIWPEDLSWTIAFTHEEGIGPYFCRREWVS